MLTISKNKIEIDDFSTIYDRLVDSFKTIYGSDVNLDSDTPDGQLLSLFAKELSYCHEACAFMIQMLDPYQATGKFLEQRAMYAGLVRNTASYSYIDEVVISGTPKTNIPVSSIFIDKNKNKWVTLNQVILDELGSARAKVRSEHLGEYLQKEKDELELSTIIIGVDSVIVGSNSYGGADEETDAELLKRFMLSHSVNNHDDREGIQAAILTVAGVEKCVVYENYTNQTDEKGVPAHSINAVILGGDDDAISEMILKKKIGGCGLYGLIENYIEFCGIERVTYFDRPALVDVDVKLEVKRYQNYTDINSDEITENLKAIDFEINEQVYASRIISEINLTKGFYITSLTVNNAQVVEIDYREYARIASVEVTVLE